VAHGHEHHEPLLRVQLPLWARLYFALGLLFGGALLLIFIASIVRQGFAVMTALEVLFILGLVATGGYFVPYLFSVYVATGTGIVRQGLMSEEMIRWDDIVALARARFGVPRGVVYIVSDSGRRMLFLTGMPGSVEMLDLISARASRLPRERRVIVRPPTSWRSAIVSAIVALIIYFAIRLWYAWYGY